MPKKITRVVVKKISEYEWKYEISSGELEDEKLKFAYVLRKVNAPQRNLARSNNKNRVPKKGKDPRSRRPKDTPATKKPLISSGLAGIRKKKFVVNSVFRRNAQEIEPNKPWPNPRKKV